MSVVIAFAVAVIVGELHFQYLTEPTDSLDVAEWSLAVVLGWTVKASLVAAGGGDVEPAPPPATSSARELASSTAPISAFFMVRIADMWPPVDSRLFSGHPRPVASEQETAGGGS